MREHPIPQDITSYRFHLVGNMTLKQFAEMVVGAILALIIYGTTLPVFIKWPLMALFFGMGAAAAFVPIEERPLDHWILVFFQALYKPTKFFWQKKPTVPEAFNFQSEADRTHQAPAVNIDVAPLKRHKTTEFLLSLPQQPDEQDDWDIAQQSQVQQILNSFSTINVPAQSTPKKITRPDLKVRVRTLQAATPQIIFDGQQRQQSAATNFPSPADITLSSAAADLTTDQTFTENSDKLTALTSTDLATQQASSPEPTISAADNSAVTNFPANNQPELTTANQPLTEVTNSADQVITDSPAATQPNSDPELNQTASTSSPDTALAKLAQIKIDPDAKMAGIVTDSRGQLIDNALIEIKSPTGQIVVAVQSNALGQFSFSGFLAPGEYLINTTKNGYDFETYQITYQGKTLPPMAIQALPG